MSVQYDSLYHQDPSIKFSVSHFFGFNSGDSVAFTKNGLANLDVDQPLIYPLAHSSMEIKIPGHIPNKDKINAEVNTTAARKQYQKSIKNTLADKSKNKRRNMANAVKRNDKTNTVKPQHSDSMSVYTSLKSGKTRVTPNSSHTIASADSIQNRLLASGRSTPTDIHPVTNGDNHSSGPNAQSAKSNNDAPAPVTDIPIGFNQIQKRLNSYVKKPSDTTGNLAVNNLEQLVVDKTHTNIGEEFFTTFNNLWKPPSAQTNYVITITEKPLSSMGTLIIVMVDNTVAFQTQLNPNSKYIDQICRQAIQYVYQKLQSQQSITY